MRSLGNHCNPRENYPTVIFIGTSWVLLCFTVFFFFFFFPWELVSFLSDDLFLLPIRNPGTWQVVRSSAYIFPTSNWPTLCWKCHSDPTSLTLQRVWLSRQRWLFWFPITTVTDASSYVYNISPGISSRYRSTLG